MNLHPARGHRDLVLFFSGTVVGVCGGFYASYQAFIDPLDMFSFDRSISFVLIGVIGGIGTILGPAMGAIVFVSSRSSCWRATHSSTWGSTERC